MLQQIISILGVAVAVIGVIGGILSLPKLYKDFVRSRSQHGQKGVGFAILERVDSEDGTTVRFLVVEDILQFIHAFCKPVVGGIATEIAAVGDYFDVTIKFPPGANLNFEIVRREAI